MFRALTTELNKWHDNGAIAQLWWRDDDAQSATPELEKLLALSEEFAVPLSLATIPDGLDNSLVDALIDRTQISVLQHGYSHQNFAPPEQRKMELGLHRPLEEVLSSLERGYTILKSSFGEQFLPVLVPPWNRIDIEVINDLKQIGIVGLSDLGPRPASFDPIKRANVHVDIVDWQHGRCFGGIEPVLEQIISHLFAKRTGQVDATEPTGIMSHHLVQDNASWTFLASLFEFLSTAQSVQLMGAHTVFDL